MPTIGHTLATQRVRRDLDLDQAAAVTRINARFLKAIEQDDFEQLPGRVFARNFIRQYAQFLQLDADSLVTRFDLEQSPSEPVFSAVLREPVSKGFSLNIPAVADVFGSTTLSAFLSFVVTIAVCAAGVWFFNHWDSFRAHVASGQPPAPSSVSAAAPAPAPKPASAEPTPAPAAAADTPKPSAPVASELDSPAVTSGNASVHVLVAASDLCWTRITADGKVLFAGMLNPGESREVNAASVVDLRAGNAGALALKLNGSVIPPLGPKGQIRSVTLTTAGAQVRTPIPDPVSEPL